MTDQWSISASFSWNDFQHIRVYGLKPDGTIVEWQYDGSWTGPSVLGPRADPGTTLAVVHTENNSGVHIRLYYHADGRIKELCYEKQWINGAVLP